MWRSTSTRIGAALLLLVAGCGEPPSEDTGSDAPETPERPDSANAPVRIHQRSFAFTGELRDTSVLVPLFFDARSSPDAVERQVRGWLGRGEEWEPFADERWETPPGRAADRILPHGPVRLIVGQGDAVRAILYDDAPRRLGLELGSRLVEWTGPRGTSYRVAESTLTLADREVAGLTLDRERVREDADPAGGDWALLTSGDSLLIVLGSAEASPPAEGGRFGAIARAGSREMQWPEVTVAWSESRAYEPARRDVPVAWSFRSPGTEITGSFRATSRHLSAGSGEGAVLPVEGLFGVEGTVTVEGTEYPVRGLFRHRRP